MLQIREIAADQIGELRQVEAVHRQLRPHLAQDYPRQMKTILDEGAGLIAAFVDDIPAGVAVWRTHHNTAHGLHLYVDDLVTDQTSRSAGVGKAILAWLQDKGQSLGCAMLILDSGVQRQQAHKFYFREGLVVAAFHFQKPL